jgi:rSAM/selenodomain-associated transferase 1
VALYRAFVEDTLGWVAPLPLAEKRIYYAPREASEEALRRLAPAASTGTLRFHPQSQGDLGARLHQAFQDTLGDGFAASVVTGTDCPLLGPTILTQALEELEKKDLVLGPAQDGGYYLVGMTRVLPELFRNVPWSTSAVLETTLTRAREADTPVALLPALGDVDTVEDLTPLYRELLHRHKLGGQEHFPARTFRELTSLCAGMDK